MFNVKFLCLLLYHNGRKLPDSAPWMQQHKNEIYACGFIRESALIVFFFPPSIQCISSIHKIVILRRIEHQETLWVALRCLERDLAWFFCELPALIRC